jgi:hypothetical protein
MRYLKLFKEGFDTEDFYKEVDRNEYHQKAGSDVEGENFRTDFEKTDRVSLEENLVDCKLRWKIKRGGTAYPNSDIEDHFYDYLKIWTYPTNNKINEEIFIFKVPDDYFIVYWTTETRAGRKGVNSKYKYYICDQVNGLLKLLTDKKIIKTSKKRED